MGGITAHKGATALPTEAGEICSEEDRVSSGEATAPEKGPLKKKPHIDLPRLFPPRPMAVHVMGLQQNQPKTNLIWIRKKR